MTDSSIRYSLVDVAKCNGKNGTNIWIVINDSVYDVTNYVQQHPGGAELIQEQAGKDATRDFEDFGHSSHAKKILKEYLIGELVEEDKRGNRNKKHAVSSGTKIGVTNGRTRRYVFEKKVAQQYLRINRSKSTRRKKSC